MRDFRIVVLGMNFIPFGVMKAKRWIVAVAMWMLVFAAVLWFESGVLKREGMRFFRFYVSASQAGSVQVFFDRGHGFREEDSVRRRVPGNERQNIVILLEPGVYKGFRIDPVDNGSAYELSSMEITRVYGSSDQSFEAAAWFSHGTGWRIEDGRIIGGGGSDSADPWHALALEPPLNVEPINSGFRHSLSAVLAQHGRALILLALVMLLGPSAGLLGSVSFFFRVVFDPGFYSPDSIDQVSQAQIGQFWDQHPVAMALFLQAWLKIGLTIRDLIFVQALAGLLGVQYTAMRVLDWMPNIQRSWRPWIACLIAVLLCTPLSPLPWYLNTLWKDTWTAILFVWVGGISLRMIRAYRKPDLNPWMMGFRWLGCFALMQSIVLIRHNALALVPILVLLLTLLFPIKRIAIRVPVFVVLLVVMVGMNPFLHSMAGTHRTYMKYQLCMMDLIGIAKLRPDAMEHLPYTAESLMPGWEERFEWANIYPVSFYRPLIVTEEYGCWTKRNPRLEAEYREAWKRFPLLMLRVKWEHYCRLFGIQYTHYWHHRTIDSNNLGIHERFATKPLRTRMSDLSFRVSESPLRWFGGVHAVWVGLNLLAGGALVAGLIRILRASVREFGWTWKAGSGEVVQHLSLLFLVLLPLGYAATFFVSSPARDFRYMYPSTLLMQVWAFSFISGWVLNRLSKKQAGPRSR